MANTSSIFGQEDCTRTEDANFAVAHLNFYSPGKQNHESAPRGCVLVEDIVVPELSEVQALRADLSRHVGAAARVPELDLHVFKVRFTVGACVQADVLKA